MENNEIMGVGVSPQKENIDSNSVVLNIKDFYDRKSALGKTYKYYDKNYKSYILSEKPFGYYIKHMEYLYVHNFDEQHLTYKFIDVENMNIDIYQIYSDTEKEKLPSLITRDNEVSYARYPLQTGIYDGLEYVLINNIENCKYYCIDFKFDRVKDIDEPQYNVLFYLSDLFEIEVLGNEGNKLDLVPFYYRYNEAGKHIDLNWDYFITKVAQNDSEKIINKTIFNKIRKTNEKLLKDFFENKKVLSIKFKNIDKANSIFMKFKNIMAAINAKHNVHIQKYETKVAIEGAESGVIYEIINITANQTNIEMGNLTLNNDVINNFEFNIENGQHNYMLNYKYYNGGGNCCVGSSQYNVKDYENILRFKAKKDNTLEFDLKMSIDSYHYSKKDYDKKEYYIDTYINDCVYHTFINSYQDFINYDTNLIKSRIKNILGVELNPEDFSINLS